MANSRGKQFEAQFSKQWKAQFPESFTYRLPDQMNGYRSSTNPCDFLCFANGRLLMIETKAHEGNTISIAGAIPQFEYLKEYVGKPGVFPIVVIWFIDHGRVVAVREESMVRMVSDGLKSINITRESELVSYDVIELPSTKLRKFMSTDYSKLLSI